MLPPVRCRSPEYNVAVDRYGSKVVVQEHAPPKTVDAQSASAPVRCDQRDAGGAGIAVESADPEKPASGRRARTSTRNWRRKASSCWWKSITPLWVNLDRLSRYRPVPRSPYRAPHAGRDEQRQGLPEPVRLYRHRQRARRLGGARSTTTVDMSRTYLEWAEKNLEPTA